MTTNGNGHNLIINAHGDTLHPEPPDLAGPIINEIKTFASVLLARSQLAARLGQTYSGNRDMYTVLGYDKVLDIDKFYERYLREDIAGRIVDLPPADTWRYPPVLIDTAPGGEESRTDEEEPDSQFIQDMKFLIEDRALWHYIERADKLAGVGQYGGLVIGIKDGQEDLTQPVTAKLAGPEGVLFFRPFSQYDVSNDLNSDLDKNPQSERFGMPAKYHVKLGENMAYIVIHHSRIIHIAENLRQDDLYGIPRLQRAWNRLDDLLKLVGGGSEATWQVMDRGLHVDVRDKHSLGLLDGGSTNDNEITTQVNEYLHKLRRYIFTEGIDIKELGSSVIDPSGLFRIVVALLSAATGIPVRKLVGTNIMGASLSQPGGEDEKQWAAEIASRQMKFGERLLRQIIKFFIDTGAVAAPLGGRYKIEWRPLYEMDDKDRAEVAKNNAEALDKIAMAPVDALIDRRDFVKHFIPGLRVLEESEVVDMQPDRGTMDDTEDNAPDMAALALNHKASRTIARLCPNCGAFGLAQYDEHGGVLVCQTCEMAFDKAEVGI